MSMILAMNKDGELEEYKEPYASIDFKTEEDYKRFEDILKYYNKRKEHDRQIDLDKLKSRLMDLKGIGPVKAEQIVEVIKNETDRCR